MICGDDALALVWSETSTAYSDIVRACGGQPSPGKHFISRGPVLRGVFLERLYEFSTSGGRVLGGRRETSIPLRGLVRVEVPPSLREYGSGLRISRLMKLLFTIDSIWAQQPSATKEIARFVSRHYPWLRRSAKELGLLNGVRLRFGGSGIPNEGPLGRKTVTCLARSILHVEGGHDFPALLREEISPLWQMAGSMARSDMEFFLASGELSITSPGGPRPGETYLPCGSVDGLTTDMICSAYRSMVLTFGDPKEVVRMSDRTVRQAILSWNLSLPRLEEGVDPYEIVRRGPTPDQTWIRRTVGPTGMLLYPRWAKETRASEAHLRAQLLGAVHLHVPC